MNLFFAYTLKRIGLDDIVKKHDESDFRYCDYFYTYFLGKQLYLCINTTDILFTRTRVSYHVIAVSDNFLNKLEIHSNEIAMSLDEELLPKLFDTMREDDILQRILHHTLKRFIEL